MQMDAVLRADIGHFRQRINGAGFGGPGNANDRDDAGSLIRFKFPDGLLEGLKIDFVALVRINRDDVLVADAKDAGRFSKRVVAQPGNQNDRPVNVMGLVCGGDPVHLNPVKSRFGRQTGVSGHP